MKKILSIIILCATLLAACGKTYTVDDCKAEIVEYLIENDFTSYGTTYTKQEDDVMLMYDTDKLGFASSVAGDETFSYYFMINIVGDTHSVLYGRTDSGVPMNFGSIVESFPGAHAAVKFMDESRKLKTCKQFIPEIPIEKDASLQDILKEITPADGTVKA